MTTAVMKMMRKTKEEHGGDTLPLLSSSDDPGSGTMYQVLCRLIELKRRLITCFYCCSYSYHHPVFLKAAEMGWVWVGLGWAWHLQSPFQG